LRIVAGADTLLEGRYPTLQRPPFLFQTPEAQRVLIGN